ncbi:MAG: hypothetical protein N2446_01320 [Elusimicrobiales bacterium]|nr:hypothetical protein [Elusimicrobiales bacterium]
MSQNESRSNNIINLNYNEIDKKFSKYTGTFQNTFEEIYGFEYLIVAKMLKDILLDKHKNQNQYKFFFHYEALNDKKNELEETFTQSIENFKELIQNFLGENNSQSNNNNTSPPEILSINISFWDTSFKRMPLVALIWTGLENFEAGWNEYYKIIKNDIKDNTNKVEEKNKKLTLNEAISQLETVPSYYTLSYNEKKVTLTFPKEITNKTSPEFEFNEEALICYWIKTSHNEKLHTTYYFIHDLSDIEQKLSNQSPQSKALIIVGISYSQQPNNDDITKTETCIKYLLLKILTFNFSRRILFEKKKAYQSALKSAVAAIMSRNMSHNIGSHVLANLIINLNASTISLNNTNSQNQDSSQNLLKDIQILTKYLQQRMDFIAQITTEFPMWSYPCWFYKDLMNDFYYNKLLLDYIAVSEGLNSKNIQLEVNKNTENDVLVSIPGGIIGKQAFYIILENIIRNAAKHGFASSKNNKNITSKATNSPNLKITINIEDTKDKKYKDAVIITIYDNVSTTNGNLENDINSYLQKKLIDDSGKLLKFNWGLSEMKIATSYLQRKDINKIGDGGQDIIQACSENNNLGYKFNLYKPKEVLIIDLSKEININNQEELNQNGIYIINNDLNNLDNVDLDYEFCVLYHDSNKDKDNKNLKDILETKIERFPYRLFLVTNDGTENEFQNLNDRVVVIKEKEIKEEEKVIINFISNIKNNKGNKELNNFKLSLYENWLKHLKTRRIDKTRRIGNGNKISIKINLTGQDISQDNRYIPPTVPQDLQISQNSNNPQIDLNMHEENIIKTIELVTDSTEIDLDSINTIIYARHKALEDERGVGCLYFESLSGASPIVLLLSSLSSQQSNYYKSKLLYQLVENGLIRIGICDERFLQSSLLLNTDNHKTPYNSYLIASGIYPVGEFLGYNILDKNDKNKKPNYWLSLSLLEDEKGNINNINIKWCSDNNNDITENNNDITGNKVGNKNLEFLIIHQGILDKLRKNKIEIEEKLTKLKKMIPFIIVTSGRGKPANIPTNVKYLPFSNIESTILSKPHNKFILTQLLMKLI